MGELKLGDRVWWYDSVREKEREGVIAQIHPFSNSVYVQPDEHGSIPVIFMPSQIGLLTKIAGTGDEPTAQT
jgi:hypothetical protein